MAINPVRMIAKTVVIDHGPTYLVAVR